MKEVGQSEKKKSTVILEMENFTFIRFFFNHCHVTIPYRKTFFFLGHCHVTFRYMEPLSLFGKFVQKELVFCCLDSFFQKTIQQTEGSCDLTRVSQLLFVVFKKQPFRFCHYIWKIMWTKIIALPTTMPRYAFHPIGDITFCFWVTLKGWYRDLTHCVSHIKNCTVSIHSSKIH